jgi:hypothetical protein
MFSTNINASSVIRAYIPPVFNVCEKEVTTRVQSLCANPKPIFSVQDHTNAIYVRNPECWCYDLSEQLTCCSPWNSYGENQRAGTLITPRHILYSKHFPIAPGTTIRFITKDNEVVTRTITLTANDSPWPNFPDIDIGLLNEDVPGTIKPCYILPDNYLDYLSYKNIPSLSATDLPCRPGMIMLDQEEKALVNDFTMFRVTFGTTGAGGSLTGPTKPKKAVLWENIIGGDSGNPGFIIYEGKLILLTVWTVPIGGSNIVHYKSLIHSLIDQLDTQAGDITGYRMQQVSFENNRPIDRITRTDIKLYNSL